MATATDPGNNTSEFSAVVYNQPAVMAFSMANYVRQCSGGRGRHHRGPRRRRRCGDGRLTPPAAAPRCRESTTPRSRAR